MRIGVLTSHPIQYQAPWFRGLAKACDLEVFFANRESAVEQGRSGFGTPFKWDVDLLSDYKHSFLKNISPRPSVSHFFGCDTPEIEQIIAGQKPEVGGKNGFDVFIVPGWYLKSHLQATRACRRAGIPIVVRGDSQLWTPRSLLKRLVMEVRQRWLLRRFDGFLSVGRRHTEYLQHFGVPSGKIFPVPHFVDNEWFAVRAAEARCQRSEIRKCWGADMQSFCVLFCGKFIPEKRPIDLVRAVALAGGRESEEIGRRTVAIFVGSGELEAQLRAEVGRLKVAAHFSGFKNQTELPSYYSAADVLVLPSESETWGLVVNEGMASGLPAVVSESVGCAPDLIEEDQTGFTFPCGDIQALASRLAKIRSLKCNGHDFAPALAAKMRHYSLDTAVTGTLQASSILAASKPA